MILLRSVQDHDLDSLERLSHVPGMFNLPSDKDLLKDRIQKSKLSFSNKITKKEDRKFTFVAEDLDQKKIIATSMIASQHGTPESPHFYFDVGQEKRYSAAINTGFIHGTLTLGYEMNGPSEIGALVVDTEHRSSVLRVGRQISFIRFLYLGLHPTQFQKSVIAELLPPLNKRGLSPLWEAIGRRFTNMDYWEADQLCSKNKDFIFELFPSGKIYTTFLSAEARNAIGKVGKETEPVLHMLKKIGFTYKNQIDPFDGGPHFWADCEQIKPIQKLVHRTYSASTTTTDAPISGLLTKSSKSDLDFKALSTEVFLSDESLSLADANLKNKIESILNLKNGDDIAFMPYY